MAKDGLNRRSMTIVIIMFSVLALFSVVIATIEYAYVVIKEIRDG